MGTLRHGTLRLSNRLGLGLGEAYRLYQVHEQDADHVVASIGLSAEQYDGLKKLLAAQDEVNSLTEIVKPLI